ncbi:SHOCT domain-containing protein [Nocardia sp. NPDC048505]|uniref:SHOCT domain-containing protein n=1 Tax=Nocardia sp. NPDC048505 TaxID=3155756 RepID=UPI0033C07715
MVLGRARIGRPGLLGAVARTAVITGTARATANAVDRRGQRHAAEQQQAYAVPAQPVPPPAAEPPGADLVGRLEQLGQLHESGALTDAEFAAAKARLLG